MTCSVAVSSSPVFSPSRVSPSLFCKKSSLSNSPENLISSPLSPLKLRLHRPFTALNTPNDGPSTSVISPSHSTPILKRKRPPMLSIPIDTFCFEASKGGDKIEILEVVEDEYSVYCKKGKRETMEDRYSAIANLQGNPKEAFFGIFDGHGGAEAAEFASQNLNKNILVELAKRGDEEIEEAIKHGYMNTDSQFLKGEGRGGSCCVSALVRNGRVLVSNAGDCRAVISRSGGIAEALTSDHRPSREDEKDRIETHGGYIHRCRGVWRIQGSLAVSRGIGDRHLKQWVIAEPETRIRNIHADDEFLILASDGLWDKISNQEAVDIAHSFCIKSGIKEKAEHISACKKLVEVSVSRGSADDISVMIIMLRNYA